MRAAIVLAVATSIASGCAEPERRATPRVDQDYRIDVNENAAAHRFDLRFVSLSRRRLCLEIDTWPFEGQMLEEWQTTVFLRSGRGRFPMHGPIAQRADSARIFVTSGEQVAGRIPFSAFSEEAFSNSTSRSLEYRAGVTFCDEHPQ
jgi:hypothetical protein